MSLRCVRMHCGSATRLSGSTIGILLLAFPASPALALENGAGVNQAPSLLAAIPFAALLLGIALLPLIRRTAHWWHQNRNKLAVSLVLAGVALVYYWLRGTGLTLEGHSTAPGLATAAAVLEHAVFREYLPFMVLLFCLYTISGGIVLRGDLRATPLTNTAFLGAGALSASFVGTTGASMLLIRPLLQSNAQREHVRHTVVFFIFLVSNIGGSLLPIGDPPLLLGYLRGVPFLWTLVLWKEWLFCTAVLLTIYYVWDRRAYRRESTLEQAMDVAELQPLRLDGGHNLLWLLGVVLSVALITPGKPFPGTNLIVPVFLREAAQLIFVGLAWITTPRANRESNNFSFGAILEVAALFIGIFITMQAPIEILHVKGPRLGLETPAQFFWATGALSSLLDNAPTYVVFFETANAMTHAPGPGIIRLIGGAYMQESLLVAISLGAVFMGANTYIGNGPNFMVKSIAESSGVKMPSFFGYMAYSMAILIPVFVLVTAIFLW